MQSSRPCERCINDPWTDEDQCYWCKWPASAHPLSLATFPPAFEETYWELVFELGIDPNWPDA